MIVSVLDDDKEDDDKVDDDVVVVTVAAAVTVAATVAAAADVAALIGEHSNNFKQALSIADNASALVLAITQTRESGRKITTLWFRVRIRNAFTISGSYSM